MKDETIKLQKFLAASGLCSRRKAEEAIAAGQVRIGDRVATIGERVHPEKDAVFYMDKRVSGHQGKPVYLMLYKPRGYVCTVRDEHGRKTVMDLIEDLPGRLYPVGRLDFESEGLLLMSNDGAFTYEMTHPSRGHSKTYEAIIDGALEEKELERLRQPFMLDGYKTRPANIELLSGQEGRTKLKIELFEGRNRQIRRMCEELGLGVKRLKRIAIGGLHLGPLRPGAYRMLSREELAMLRGTAKKEGRKVYKKPSNKYGGNRKSGLQK